jgi:hypothetical protein
VFIKSRHQREKKMSRLDHKVAEANRVAFSKAQADKAQAEAIVEWLQEYPEVGSLNSGKFYVYPAGGEYREIPALSIPSNNWVNASYARAFNQMDMGE